MTQRIPTYSWVASLTNLLIGLLALSFVLTGLRRQTGFIVLEPWEVVAVACFGAWAIEAVRDRQFSLELDMVGLFALAVVAGAWLSFFGALDVLTWFKRAMRVTCLFGVYLFLVKHLRNEQELFKFLRFVILACAVASLLMIGQVIEWVNTGADFGRLLGGGFRGTFANANEGSTYVALFVVLVLPLLQWQVRESWTSGWVAVAMVTLCAIGVLVGQSRTGLACLVLGAAIVFVGGRRIGYLSGLATLGGILAWFLLSPGYLVARLFSTFGASGDSNLDAFAKGGAVMRTVLANMYWEVIKARPIFGIGAANSGFMGDLHLNWPPVPAGAIQGFETIDRYVGFSSHNGFLNWWAETGTVGVLPFIGSLMYALWALWRFRGRDSLPLQWRALALGTVAGISAFIGSNLTGDFGVSEARYWVLLALVSITLRLPNVGQVDTHTLFFARWGRERDV